MAGRGGRGAASALTALQPGQAAHSALRLDHGRLGCAPHPIVVAAAPVDFDLAAKGFGLRPLGVAVVGVMKGQRRGLPNCVPAGIPPCDRRAMCKAEARRAGPRSRP